MRRLGFPLIRWILSLSVILGTAQPTQRQGFGLERGGHDLGCGDAWCELLLAQVVWEWSRLGTRGRSGLFRSCCCSFVLFYFCMVLFPWSLWAFRTSGVFLNVPPDLSFHCGWLRQSWCREISSLRAQSSTAGWWPVTIRVSVRPLGSYTTSALFGLLNQTWLPLAAGWACVRWVCSRLPSPWPTRLQAQDLITSPPPTPRGRAPRLSAHSPGLGLLL